MRKPESVKEKTQKILWNNDHPILVSILEENNLSYMNEFLKCKNKWFSKSWPDYWQD